MASFEPNLSLVSRKTRILGRFFIFFHICHFRPWGPFWMILGAKNIDFSKILQIYPKTVHRGFWTRNLRFRALKNQKSSFYCPKSSKFAIVLFFEKIDFFTFSRCFRPLGPKKLLFRKFLDWLQKLFIRDFFDEIYDF